MTEKPFREINILRPKQGYMQEEVKIIFLILIAWAMMTFGFKLLLSLVAETPAGESLLTRLTFFNLPFNFWFTGQFLPLWFIILCIIFNLYIDRLSERHSRRRDRSHD
ncbi:DUF4212 domain-containing protein [Geobacter sp. DSM 9736]|uniref:DUF4212 domain-containing protein n=1 Tax=Geobacter sp. DSM 9736 TaxID=1277350 RepID=UPI000B50F356|nr:DUF4212 domain-containing protein [Geobacter sp. DSM 9736]SNB47999.1 putative solute:sodium symporter small subunit [Geobacter sp. DSM 9736]